MEDPGRNNPNSPFEAGPSNLDPKTIALISYVTIVGWIVAVVLNNPKSDFASFHIRQSLGIIALATAAGLVGIVPLLGWVASIAGWVVAAALWILGLLNAAQGETKPVPFLGEQFQEWFRAL